MCLMAATLVVDVQHVHTHALPRTHLPQLCRYFMLLLSQPACPSFVFLCLCDQVNTADWNDRLGLNQRFVSNNVVGALVFGGILAGTLV